MRQIALFLLLLLPSILSAYEQEGVASWYGPNFHGKKTANGEVFNTYSLTAAHQTLPLNSIVKVVSMENNKEVIVRINDRGPFAKNRIIDLSKAAAAKLGLLSKGTMNVKIYLLKEGDNKYYRYSASRYTIQIGSFKEKKHAETMQQKLAANFLAAEITEINANGQLLYRVEIKNLTYGMLHSQKLSLHNAGFNEYLIKKYRG